MKGILLAITLAFLLAVGASAQCTSIAGYQCVPQETMNRINKALDELAASRDVIAKLQAANAASEAKNASAAAIIDKANEILALDKTMFTSYQQVVELQQKTLALYADLVEKLTAKINAPKSAWSKFLTAVKEIAYLAAGIAIARL